VGAEDGRRRVVIEAVTPRVDDGRFPAKRVRGDEVVVEADVFADGHDAVSCVVLYRRDAQRRWREAVMEPLANDRWRGRFAAAELGGWRYTIEAWIDAFETWRGDLVKRVGADQDVTVDLLIGADLVAAAAGRARGAPARTLDRLAAALRGDAAPAKRVETALSAELRLLMEAHPDRSRASRYDRELPLWVDRERARFSSWYELFPRSASDEPGRPGTFRDVEARLPYVAEMGFDVLYLPPIHPVGRTRRKGKNNAEVAGPGDVGSPWAIGAEEGGHKAIHAGLGSEADLRRLVDAAAAHGLELALDLAFQVAPDHPYVTAHPEWFRPRPDGTVQYAENPPKKYQDIYPFDFETDHWRALWRELKSVVDHWVDQGIRIFRVDNPHTKPFAFWEWLISETHARHPEVIFLSEAFTRPKIMYRLAKLGFQQSYTYFAWRYTRHDFETYLAELTAPPVVEFFRPNFWPNTPDILTEQLQTGTRGTFMARLVLAATLSSSYGIYGPAFELMEQKPREPGSEEYLHSEKYQIRTWDLDRADSLRRFIGRVNRARRENAALHDNRTLRFHDTQNPQLIAYSKATADGSNVILTVVNLSPLDTHSGFVELPVDAWGLDRNEPFQVRDLLTDATYVWSGTHNYVELDPHRIPAHIFRLVRARGG
jgi:starch synthase (maltosyl-transferring)